MRASSLLQADRVSIEQLLPAPEPGLRPASSLRPEVFSRLNDKNNYIEYTRLHLSKRLGEFTSSLNENFGETVD